MGLDIHVNVSAGRVIDDLEDWPNSLQRAEGLRVLRDMAGDKPIHTRTGTYHGLHELRQQYAKLKDWPIDNRFHVPITDQTRMSHLVNHSDCDGYYLPNDFPEPQWITTTGARQSALSIGSSVRLLDELCELLAVKDRWPDDLDWRWDALFAAAIASLASHVVIVFS